MKFSTPGGAVRCPNSKDFVVHIQVSLFVEAARYPMPNGHGHQRLLHDTFGALFVRETSKNFRAFIDYAASRTRRAPLGPASLS